MCRLYATLQANSHQSIFVALYQMSVALLGSSIRMFMFTSTQVTKLPQQILIVKKSAAIVIMEVAEVQGVTSYI